MDSPLQHIRLIFDLMATDTDENWATISRRMAAVPSAEVRILVIASVI